MIRHRLLGVALLTFALAPACGDKDDTSVDDSAESDADADADADTDTDTDADSDVEANAQLTGVVVDINGEAIEGARVSMCKYVCRTATTDGGGAYEMPLLEPFAHSFEVVVPNGSYSTPLVPLTMQDSEVRTLDATVPNLDPLQAIPASSPTEMELTTGLMVTLSQDTIEPPFGGDDTMGSGVRVAPEHWLPVEVGTEVLGMWYLAPFDGHPEGIDGFPFRVANDLGLSSGETVHAWVADYTAAEWFDAGEMTVNGAGDWLENDGTGLPLLSTLVLVR